MGRWRRALGVVLAGSVVLVGCGGGGGGGGGGEEASTPATVDSQAAGNDGVAAVGGSTGAFTASDCIVATSSPADLYGDTGQAMANVTDRQREQLATLEGYAEKVPPELKPDVRLLAEALADFLEVQANITRAAVAVGVDPSPETLVELRAVAERIGSGEFIEAAGRLSAWLDAECGP